MGDGRVGPADDLVAAGLPELAISAETRPMADDVCARMFHRDREPAEVHSELACHCLVVGCRAPLPRGTLQQEISEIAGVEHVDFERIDIGREIRQAARDHNMTSGELADQLFRLCQRLRRVDVVENQQPAAIGCEPIEHGAQPCPLLLFSLFR